MLLRGYCKLRSWLAQQDGADMVEYAIIAAIVVVGLLLVLGDLRDALKTNLCSVVKALTNAPTANCK